MADETELKRVLAIARAHARTALGKPRSQRDSYLAYCRSGWKRYAAGVTRRAEECERFAAAIDRATRDLVLLAEVSPDDLWEEHRPAWEDTVEGAMDSVLTHEAHIEPEPAPDAEPAVASAPDAAPPAADLASPLPETEPAIPSDEQRGAEEEDRAEARYGFSGTTPREILPKVEPPPHAPELQRRVRDVLRAHLVDKGD
jgi:hypothetical protein